MAPLAIGLLGVAALVVLAIVLAGVVVAAATLRRPLDGRWRKSPEQASLGGMPEPLEDTRRFVKRYWADEGQPESVAEDLRYMAQLNPAGIRAGVEAIDALLADPPPPGVLLQLVSFDGNYPLDSGTDEEAAEWLREFAAMARTALADAR